MVYWSDVTYPKPIPNSKNDEVYEKSPVKGKGPLRTYEDGWEDELRATTFGLVGDFIDGAKSLLGISKSADAVLEAKLKDLFRYYTDKDVRSTLRNRLKEALLRNADHRSMLIAHSMGSIVAYDVLRQIGKEAPNFRLAHFVTIGSPLGLPHVVMRIRDESPLVRTPSVVDRWTNLADRRDPVSLDIRLRDDYDENDRGVKVKDDLVYNDYVNGEGEGNAHKS